MSGITAQRFGKPTSLFPSNLEHYANGTSCEARCRATQQCSQAGGVMTQEYSGISRNKQVVTVFYCREPYMRSLLSWVLAALYGWYNHVS